MAIGTTAAILGSAALGAGASILGNNSQNKAQQQSAQASQQAANAATDEQRRQYDLSRGDNQPWLQTGQAALGQLANMYGLNTGGAAANSGGSSALDWGGYLTANPDVQNAINNGYFGGVNGEGGVNGAAQRHWQEYGDAFTAAGRTGPQAATPESRQAQAYSGFMASPDYQFRQDEQMRALTARNSALGVQDSGAAQKAALRYSGNLASGEFNNYANRLASLAGVGQTAAGQNQALGQNYAGAVGNIAQNNAQNLSSSYQNRAAGNATTYGNIAGIGTGLLQNFARPNYGGPAADLMGLY